ncbi:hypothetical protein [Virgibacillus pantothenticus]|uniref:DUF3942 domain-containing protein n=2 Tax=Virgibacillus pantothenticus TaxID=1473 RepID=A0A0L0QV90_VIRPA|nr:hypothetical protein [Virgibacillus pantothenticus]KNE22486.1 hypothetical protein AFK71_02385 [Virgibacillus pantothenticus]MED3737259.1 hypothetical protein [Virgibacillus pantothenticus]QTY16956.1 hypothetical protein KBP50_03265 [Virgibacillus pantothenticus]
MDRKEIADKIRQSVIDKDKELIVDTIDKLKDSIARFYIHDVALKAKYPELSWKITTEPEGIKFNYKNTSLIVLLNQEDYKITVSKKTADDETVLDEIVANNGKLTCHDGEFNIDEVDDYLAKCFATLLD